MPIRTEKFYGTWRGWFSWGRRFIDAADGPEHLGLGHLMVVHGGPVIDPGPGQEGIGVDDVGGGARRFPYSALH